MRKLIALLALTATGCAGGHDAGRAHPPIPHRPDCLSAQPSDSHDTTLSHDDLLEEAYQALLERSATFRAAVDTLTLGRNVELRIGRPGAFEPAYEFRPSEKVARVWPHWSHGSKNAGPRLTRIDVVLYTNEIVERALKAKVSPSAIRTDLALILAHEVFGHAVSLANGAVPGALPCRDPKDGRKRGCAVERENRIRTELGLPLREAYGVMDLTLWGSADYSLCQPSERTIEARRAMGQEVTGGPGS